MFEPYRPFSESLRDGLAILGSPRPSALDLELTNRCNLHCPMCWFHGARGSGDRYGDAELTPEDVSRLAGQISPFVRKIYLGGGEPLVRGDFLDIVQLLKQHGFTVAFATNGTLMNSRTATKLVQMQVDHINFSIDGPEDQHDGLRGRGVFGRAVEAIRRLSERKKKHRRTKPVIGVNITVNGSMHRRLGETIAAIRSATHNAVDAYRIHHVWYITPAELTRHQQTVKRYLGVRAGGAACHLLACDRIPDPRSLAEELRGMPHSKSIEHFPDLNSSEIMRFYSEGTSFPSRCSAPWHGAVVKPNGDVKFCPDEWIDDYILGNIRQAPFMSLWNNARARRFRAVLFFQRRFAGCKRCSWMYSY